MQRDIPPPFATSIKATRKSNPKPNPSPSSVPMAISLLDFPEDVQLNILSFLSPADVSSFACTSRRSAALCAATADSPLWLAMCHRRWASKTRLPSWLPVPHPRLYRALDRWDSLLGFWRQIGTAAAAATPLLFFEWGPSYIAGSRVSPAPEADSYAVAKIPFLWLGLSPHGDPLCFLDPAGRPESAGDVFGSAAVSELVPVSVSFMGLNHLVLEESFGLCSDAEEMAPIESDSPPDRLMAEIYQYFANRTSPCSDKSQRRQRRRYRNRLGRRRHKEAQHFVKIVDCCPTPDRPLQGLWKVLALHFLSRLMELLANA